MMATAKFLKNVTDMGGGAPPRGKACLYELDPPLGGHKLVVVSAVHNDYVYETFIFPSDEEGHITGWLELPGSVRNTVNHADALLNAGYDQLILEA